jgi:proline iminopeptidase
MQLHYKTHNWAFRRNQASYDILARLPEIRVPTLVTAGRHDWITPLEANREIAEAIPDAELVVFENSGHSPQEEERERWLEVVGAFLARVAPPTAGPGTA